MPCGRFPKAMARIDVIGCNKEIGQQAPAPPEAVAARIPNHTTREALNQTCRDEGLTRHGDLDALKKGLTYEGA